MSFARAPRGIPTGGQFVARTAADPTISLTPQAPDRERPWATLNGVPDSPGPRQGRASLDVLPQDEEASEPAPELPEPAPGEGSFVTWDQMVPRFLRRK